MTKRDSLYAWWKQKNAVLRKPVVFTLGLALICVAPLVGWIPGPGGILVFLAGIGILGSEFDWALSLKQFFLKTVPAEVKKRWQPTPRWQFTFDVTSALLLTCALFFVVKEMWSPALSSGVGGLTLYLFGDDRLSQLKKWLGLRRKKPSA